jgi:dihydrofolate reductase
MRQNRKPPTTVGAVHAPKARDARGIVRKPAISLVVAMSENWVIGFSKRLPWNLPEDLRHFRRITIDHTIVMGRKTFESIGRALPRRRNIVISSRKSSMPKGVELVSSLNEALEQTRTEQRVYVIGGGQIFLDALPLADRIHLTLVYVDEPQESLFEPIPGDVYFPYIDPAEWRIKQLGRRRPARVGEVPKKRRKGVYYRFIELVRAIPSRSVHSYPPKEAFHWASFMLTHVKPRKPRGRSSQSLASQTKSAVP